MISACHEAFNHREAKHIENKALKNVEFLVHFSAHHKNGCQCIARFFEFVVYIALKLHCNIDGLFESLFERISASKVCNKEISKIKVTLMFDD